MELINFDMNWNSGRKRINKGVIKKESENIGKEIDMKVTSII
jgi:hypothetical protein